MKLQFYFSPYCGHCQAAFQEVERAAREVGLDERIEHCNVLEHLESAVASGVRNTPALALDGRLIASGRLQANELVDQLQQVLRREQHA